LADSDSDFSDFSSVKSDKNKLHYERKYNEILRDEDGNKQAAPIKFDIHNRCKT